MLEMFRKDPSKKLRKQYDVKLEQAMLAQRNGDIKTYSMLTAESEALWSKLKELEREKE